MSIELLKVVYGISNFRIILFHSFSFFSKLRFPPCPTVRYYTGPVIDVLYYRPIPDPTSDGVSSARITRHEAAARVRFSASPDSQ